MVPDDDEDAASAGRSSRRSLLTRAAGITAVALVAGGGTAAVVGQRDAGAGRLVDRSVASETGGPTTARVLWRARTSELVLALTFDDGPVERWTRPLLELLTNERVPATFCVVGERVLEQSDLVRRELSGRHELANHSFDHPDLSTLAAHEVREQLGRTDEAVHRLTGQRTSLVRPPFGRLSGTVLEVAAQSGHDLLLWDRELHEKSESSARNAAHVLEGLQPGMVLLAHDGGPGPHQVGLAALPEVIRGARARGYRFVTASELFSLHK